MTPAKRPSTRARQTRIQSLDDLQPDPLNANRGTDRGREALRRSLHTYGAGRSIVIDMPNLNPMGGARTPENPITGHGTQKPVRLFEIPIRNHTIEGDGVYDPFCGTGTAIIAAEKLRRRCYAQSAGEVGRGGARPASDQELGSPLGRKTLNCDMEWAC